MNRPYPLSRPFAVALSCWSLLLLGGLCRPAQAADFLDPGADADALPTVPPGFEVTFFAREPLVRQPCSLAFDAQGRLCVGMGPQYRNPRPETPGDSVVLVLDTDRDGRADTTKVFATGFNAIQGIAWRGKDLWVANAPDLTIVRDLDGDDEADEYVRVYTDLGNLEHGLHGLNWAPDGRLYMSKGNSKGLSLPGRYAPKAFRDLWGVQAPVGTPDLPAPVLFRKGEYRRAYHDPEDDWGLEGGVLRCDPDGSNLEIVSRGFRNPWDITFDTGFHWLGTDNDQTTGDRVFMPFPGAHFGWNHPWSAHWSEAPHAPSAPVSGPLFEGSGTGVIHVGASGFPDAFKGAFLINDWLQKTTYLWRPRWDGPLMRPDGTWTAFIQGGPSLYRPTDMEFGPDGALWVLGWSRGYGAEYKDGQLANEGRVFRVMWKGAPSRPGILPAVPGPLRERSLETLIEAFDAPVSTWRVDAQDELVRRGSAARDALVREFDRPASQGRETWCAWTLGRLSLADRSVDADMAAVAADARRSLNARIQALRILAFRERRRPGGKELPPVIISSLRDPEVRIRFEAVLAMRELGRTDRLAFLWDVAATETDSTTFYANWQTLRFLADPSSLRAALQDPREGVRRAGLLALLEDHRLSVAEVRPLARDHTASVRDLAEAWLRKAAAGGESAQVRGRPLAVAPAAAKTQGVPATQMDEVLALIARGDASRGERLFQDPQGAGCIQCHSIDGRGNAFAPDLSALGDRATSRHLVESILHPNAVITEGFQLHTIETDGEEIAGILIEESGLSVTLGLATGQRRTVPKSGIRSRRSGPGSAMPAFDTALRAAEVADLVAYLLRPKPGAISEPARISGSVNPKRFEFEKREDRLLIRLGGQAAAEFVFRDERIRRPYFANVMAPNHVKVTRNHPPVPGKDATDHDTMHPGVWLAFGDISGADFWRNKGRMEHLRFDLEPGARGEGLSFGTQSRLESTTGETLGYVEQRFRLATLEDAWMLCWEASFQAPDREFAFGDQEEMGFGARVATAITEKGGGRIRSSTGLETASATWGKAAAWCDYSGVAEGVTAGITLIAHPGNFRESWWHNRDYGVFVANPFGRASMKQGPPSAVVVRRGGALTLRFGAVFHAGEKYDAARAYQAFLRTMAETH